MTRINSHLPRHCVEISFACFRITNYLSIGNHIEPVPDDLFIYTVFKEIQNHRKTFIQSTNMKPMQTIVNLEESCQYVSHITHNVRRGSKNDRPLN